MTFYGVFAAKRNHQYLRWFGGLHKSRKNTCNLLKSTLYLTELTCFLVFFGQRSNTIIYDGSEPYIRISKSHIFHEFKAEIERKYSVFSCFIGGARTSLFTTLSKHGENVEKTPANLSSIIGKWAGDWVAVWGWLGWLTGLAGLAGSRWLAGW